MCVQAYRLEHQIMINNIDMLKAHKKTNDLYYVLYYVL